MNKTTLIGTHILRKSKQNVLLSKQLSDTHQFWLNAWLHCAERICCFLNPPYTNKSPQSQKWILRRDANKWSSLVHPQLASLQLKGDSEKCHISEFSSAYCNPILLRRVQYSNAGRYNDPDYSQLHRHTLGTMRSLQWMWSTMVNICHIQPGETT